MVYPEAGELDTSLIQMPPRGTHYSGKTATINHHTHQDLGDPRILLMKSAAGDDTQRATEHANDDDFQFKKTKWEKEGTQCL